MVPDTIENLALRGSMPAFKKNIFWISLVFIALFAASCNNSSDTGQDDKIESAYRAPVTVSITFTKERKINWAKTSTIPFSPTTIDIDIDQLPLSSYADTSGFKPLKSLVDTVKFTGYNSLPKKSFDADKFPVKPLIFHTTVLPAPKIIKAGPPQAINGAAGGLNILNNTQGLEGSIVSSVYEDHDGFIWIATEKGVYRYDGETLVRYIADPLTLIFTMTEDASGRIWMGSIQYGLAVFNPKTAEYSKIGKDVTAGDSVLRLVTDKYNRVWVGTAKGLTVIHPDAGTYSRPGLPDGFTMQKFTTLAMDKEQRLWINHDNSFDIVDLEHKTISNLKFATGVQGYDFAGILCDSKDNVWLGSAYNGILDEIDLNRQQVYIFHDILKQHNVVTGLSEDSYGHILFSGIDGIKIIDPATRSLKDLTVLKLSKYANDKIIQNITDRNGNTWLATSYGLYVYKQNSLSDEHIGNDDVASVVMDNRGVIYEGSTDGLRLIDRKKKTIRLLSEKTGLVNNTIQNLVSLPDGRVAIGTNAGYAFIDSARRHIQNFKGPIWYAYATDRMGKMWLCGRYGIDIYDPQKKTSTHLGTENGIGQATDILIDNMDNIWLLQQDGTFDIIDPQRQSIKKIDLHLPPGNAIIMHNNTGPNRWVGTSKGIFIIDIAKKTALQFGVPQGLGDETVISLLKRGDTIYAGTNKGVSAITNVNKLDRLKIVSFGRAFGLQKINIGFWMTDNLTLDGKYIWGDKGLSILNLAPGMRHTDPDVYISGFSLSDEPAYFTTPVHGSSDTMLRYNPSGKVTGPYNLPLNLEIPYHKSSLQFSFTSHSQFKTDTSWYRYMLTGTDKTWRKKTDQTTTGSYYNLAPGWYTFKVQAMANDGDWSKPAFFDFYVLPPWWQTWWARVLFVLLFAGLIWYIVHLRSQSLRRSKKLLEQKVAIRTQEVMEQKEEIAAQRDSLEQALGELRQTQSQLIQSEKMASLGELTAGIAHEIQNPLNFVNNFSEVNAELIDELQIELEHGDLEEVKAIAIDIQENEKKINAHGKRADAIVKGMLQHSRAGSGQKEPTDINKLADEYLRLSYHGLRAKDKSFNAEMLTHFDGQLPLVKVLPQELGRVLLNLFNNAFYAVHQKQKTGDAGYKPSIGISTSKVDDHVVITVKDNGMGIPDAVKDKIMQPFFTTKPTGEGTGLGLSLSYDIVVKGHGGRIQVNSAEGKGSEFIIMIPIF